MSRTKKRQPARAAPQARSKSRTPLLLTAVGVVAFIVVMVILARPDVGGSDPDPVAADPTPAPGAVPVDLPPREEFQQIAERLYADSEMFGRRHADTIRSQRQAAGSNLAKGLAHTSRLVHQLLRDGQVDQAVAEVDQLLATAPLVPELRNEYPRFLRDRGLAYLRQAEVENCVKRHNAECCLFPLQGRGVHELKGPAAEARRSYATYLQHRPHDLGVRWLLNIASMALGDYPDGVPSQHLIPATTYDADRDVGRFRDVASQLGIDTLNLCGGCIADDFDGDRILDIVTSTIDPGGPITYYRNNGDGSFDDRSAGSGLDEQLGGLNIVGADYDNDGDVDVFVLRGAWLFDEGRIRNSLLRNNGNGTFADVTRAAGVAEPASPTQAAVWGDFDNDGDLDLYVSNESRADLSVFPVDQSRGGDYPAQLFRNDGDGTFTDVADAAGVTSDRYCKGVTAGDFDNDGDLDLYLSNIGRNRLYRNNGDGTFTDVASALGVTEPDDRSFATWFFDYDNDGWLDLFVTAYDATIDDVAADYLGLQHAATAPRLYRNTGASGTVGFEDVTEAMGLDRPFLPMGANFGDIDNDGWLDIYLTMGEPSYEALMPNVMLRNDEARGFEDVSRSGGFGHLQKGHGVAFADLDNDGDQDVYHQLGGFFRGDAYRNALFLNPGHDNRFLTVGLVGTESNRSGYGARIAVEVATPSGPRVIHRAAGSVSSFGGSPRRQEIGLGDATTIERLVVHWPVSGERQVFQDVPLDSWVEATEGDDALRVLDVRAIQLGR